MSWRLVAGTCCAVFFLLLSQWVYFKYMNLSEYVSGLKNEKQILQYQNEELVNGFLDFDRINSIDFFKDLEIKNNSNEQVSIRTMLTNEGPTNRVIYIPYTICSDCYANEFEYIEKICSTRTDIKVIFQSKNFQDFKQKSNETNLFAKSYYSRIKPGSREVKNILIFQIDDQFKVVKTSLLVSKYAFLNNMIIKENLEDIPEKI